MKTVQLIWLSTVVAGLTWATVAVAIPPPPAEPTPAAVPDDAQVPPASPSRLCKPAAPDERFSVDFEDAPLVDVARLLSCASGRNIMFSPAQLGKKTVTVIGPRPVTLREFRDLWLAVLANESLKTERRGAYEVILGVSP